MVRGGFRAVVFCTAVVSTSCALAQAYPARPVRVIVPYAAGGPVDTVARIAAQNLSTKWSQQAIVDNRVGSGGALGTQAVVKSPPDGYTLLVTNSGPITSYPHMRKTVAYDFERDLAPISLLSKSSMVLVVHPSLPAKNVSDLVALAKKNPGSLSYATSGVGGIQHLAMVLLERSSGIRLVHVPYKGASQSQLDLLSGQVPMQFNSVLGTIEHIRQGKLRPLGVTTTEPSPALPGVPPIARTYPGFEVVSWLGAYAPAGTPKPVIEQLSRDFASALERPEAKQRLNELGLDLVLTGPAELLAHTRAESRLLGKLVEAAGIPKE